MSDLSAFPISRRWPARHPERIQLYSLNTPNGVKASIMLEETGLPYEVHLVDFSAHDQTTPEFLSLNPNNKIPAIIDPNGPGGKPLPLWESGAILVYLADKANRFIATNPALRYETLQWVMFQVANVGPMFGQVGFFVKMGGKDIEDKRPRDRYINETRRLLGVLEQRMVGRDWIMGGYSIADIATWNWVNAMDVSPESAELIGMDNFRNIRRVLDAYLARPAVQRGLQIPKKPE